MNFELPPEMLDEMRDEPNFLRITPDGFDDGSGPRAELTCTVLEATTVKKRFVDNALVHTSEHCNSDPKCQQCNDPRTRKYIRLRVATDGCNYQLDVPPGAAPRFVELARKGIDGALRLTCRRMERQGRAWGEIGFEVVTEAAR